VTGEPGGEDGAEPAALAGPEAGEVVVVGVVEAVQAGGTWASNRL
jgi:hypothetical protein